VNKQYYLSGDKQYLIDSYNEKGEDFFHQNAENRDRDLHQISFILQQ
jgi:hypothetical protein